MKKNAQSIQQFVIVGGGTTGWIAAATLANIFKGTAVGITLVESAEIGIIGVGEATIPPFLATLHSLGLDEAEFIKATQGSFKLGIRFEDWHQRGEHYFHPFGSLGRSIDGHDFFQCWLKARAEGDTTPLMAHSPESVLSDHGKFFLPHKALGTALAGTHYALHLDATLVGQYLRAFAEKLGVVRVEGHVESVQQTDVGDITSVQLKDGRQIAGDFFVDCSGFRGLLIEQTLHTGYDDWSAYLPCNRAVTVQTKNVTAPTPYTTSTAKDSGWMWRIPLQHRTGNGYVFCDKFCSDEEATATLLASVEGELMTAPRVIPFVTGIRKQAWNRNCLALGLAQGFLEPLESTAIHLVSKTLALFVRMFPDRSCNPLLRNEFNRRVRADYEEIRDFLVLHYCTTQRSDTPFWRWCQTEMKIPPTLQQKLDFFRAAGGLIPGTEELFQPTSWYAVFTGMGQEPAAYNPTLDALDYSKLAMSMQRGKDAILAAALKQPSHADFLAEYCQAPKI
jgi:tryptophan 7-halogenase